MKKARKETNASTTENICVSLRPFFRITATVGVGVGCVVGVDGGSGKGELGAIIANTVGVELGAVVGIKVGVELGAVDDGSCEGERLGTPRHMVQTLKQQAASHLILPPKLVIPMPSELFDEEAKLDSNEDFARSTTPPRSTKTALPIT